MLRHSRHAVAAASHFGSAVVGCVLTGVFTGAAAGLIQARMLNGRRDRHDRALRFLDVRRVTYGRLLSCFDSQTDAVGSLVAARAAHENARLAPMALEDALPLAKSAQASERADEGMKELRSIVVEIEILGGGEVLIQALKLLEAVCGAKSHPEQMAASSAARKQFVVAADADVAFGRSRLLKVS